MSDCYTTLRLSENVSSFAYPVAGVWVWSTRLWKWRRWWSFLLGRKIGGLVLLKPRANGGNIVGQQIPTIVGCNMLCPFTHPVLCCCVLLQVVAQSLKPVERLVRCKRTQQLLTLFVGPGQQCWEFLRPFACIFRGAYIENDCHSVFAVPH